MQSSFSGNALICMGHRKHSLNAQVIKGFEWVVTALRNCDEINNSCKVSSTGTLSIQNSIVQVRFIFLEEFLG